MDFKSTKTYILDRLEKELPSNLHYHGIHHTLDVYDASIKIGELENLSQEEKIIVNTAALYHDSGFVFQYEENEVLAVKMINEVLPRFAYNGEQIKRISNIILATRVKAHPKTLLEQIVCDADYDYLGRNDVAEIAEKLYRELNEYGFIFSKKDWVKTQIEFLNAHKYYTKSSIQLRQDNKLKYLDYLKSL